MHFHYLWYHVVTEFWMLHFYNGKGVVAQQYGGKVHLHELNKQAIHSSVNV